MPLAQEMPGHDIGMMFHHRQHDLVARLVTAQIAVGDKIDRFGAALGERSRLPGALRNFCTCARRS